MTVQVRYLVVRDGKEVAMYLTKKEADAHDRMLDIASALADFIQKAETVSLEEEALEELSIYLSKNREALVRLLKGGAPQKAATAPARSQPKDRRAKADKAEPDRAKA